MLKSISLESNQINVCDGGFGEEEQKRRSTSDFKI
jgi:hypothetical protein